MLPVLPRTVRARLRRMHGLWDAGDRRRLRWAAGLRHVGGRHAGAAASLVEAIALALDTDWKTTRGPVAAQYARNRFSVTGQVTHLLAEVDRLST